MKTLTGSGAPQISGAIVPQSEKSQILTLRGYPTLSCSFHTASVDSWSFAEDRFLAHSGHSGFRRWTSQSSGTLEIEPQIFAGRPRGAPPPIRSCEGLSGRERPSQLGFDELVVSLFFGPFDRGDIWSAARPPVSVRVAGVYSHGLSDQMHPVPDANFVLAVERRQFAVAGMKNRTDNVATGYGGGRPRITGCGGQGAGYGGQGAAHMAGMRRSLDQFQTRNAR